MNKMKKEVRRKEWAEQVRECENSGLSIREWCKQNGVNIYTYYRRLRKLREELLEQKATDSPQIVPISVSNEILGTAFEQLQRPQSDLTPDSKVVMRKNGIEIELPGSISEKTLLMLLRGLKEC